MIRLILLALIPFMSYATSTPAKVDDLITPKKVLIYFFVDDSTSMKPYQQVLGNAAKSFLDGLTEKGCVDYEVAVSYLSYFESDVGGPLLVGEPAYITPATKNGLSLLRERLTPRFEERAGKESVVDPVLRVVEMARERVKEKDLVVAFILSDAGPSYDRLSATEALAQIHNIIPADKFVAYALGIDFSRERLGCAPDHQKCANSKLGKFDDRNSSKVRAYLGSYPNLTALLRQCAHKKRMASPFLLWEFTKASGGARLDMCKDDYTFEISGIVSSILDKANCSQMLMM